MLYVTGDDIGNYNREDDITTGTIGDFWGNSLAFIFSDNVGGLSGCG